MGLDHDGREYSRGASARTSNIAPLETPDHGRLRLKVLHVREEPDEFDLKLQPAEHLFVDLLV